MASGDTLAWFGARRRQGGFTTMPSIDLRNGHWLLGYPNNSDAEDAFAGVLPYTYDFGGLDITLITVPQAGGVVKWELAWERIIPGSSKTNTDNFETAVALSPNYSGSVDLVYYHTASLTAAQCGYPQRKEAFRLKVKRLGTDAGDTLNGTINIMRVRIDEA